MRSKSSRLNVDKMRRNLVRHTPDAEWRSFDRMAPDVEDQIKNWVDLWSRAIARKHGSNLADAKAYTSDQLNGTIRVQMVAVLHDPKRRPFSKKKLVIPSVWEANMKALEREMVTPFEFRKTVFDR